MIYDWNSPESDFTLPGYANTRANYVPNSFGGGTIYATTTYTAPT
ncbi:hypothetical protein SAMN02745166_04999 [Prosthecobacter debontii]|uniref:Uncharacterized protein n=1 Tax=Prosthecobacter debontii TaxID=48467 RepID=A0A1T4Z4A0_9BACT|nr:hypothetical protein [Prosthecobacter debontii]SKB08703.1 hypothetical protein SAMN02745166_04999 [Prosthecobacter debontii]